MALRIFLEINKVRGGRRQAGGGEQKWGGFFCGEFRGREEKGVWSNLEDPRSLPLLLLHGKGRGKKIPLETGGGTSCADRDNGKRDHVATKRGKQKDRGMARGGTLV